MANKANGNGQAFVVPAKVNGNPDTLAKWCKERAKEIRDQGMHEAVLGAGGQRAYRLPNGKPVIARPEDAMDRIQDALAQLCAKMSPRAAAARAAA
ncbi:MAG: hypothetical protein KGI49_03590 [Patescibacteria group bacterium]|nr:hypothetical protein [Patescibacteria group bacterium]